jgi:uncharacterized phage protein (TIGR01671 family)
MKREIKFRAWHKELKKMLYPPNKYDSMFDCRDSEGNHVTIVKENKQGVEKFRIPAHMTWDGRCYVKGYYQDLEWMQFTGLKDINGKEIFEGDIVHIVEVDDRKNKYDFVCTVEFGQHNPAFLARCSKEYAQKQGRLLETFKIHNYEAPEFIEVIGNIFENPELLEST